MWHLPAFEGRTQVKKLKVTVACASIPALFIAGCGGSDDANTNTSALASKPTTLAVIGDSPYGNGGPTDTAQFLASPAFIKAINDDPDASVVLHVGDIHSGKEYCTQAYDLAVYKLWTAFRAPLVYTPGDNEWTDCHKAKEGGGTYNSATGKIDYVVAANGALTDYAGGDPVANLQLVRSIFFAAPGMALGAGMSVHSQAQAVDVAHPSDGNYVENVWFERAQVLSSC